MPENGLDVDVRASRGEFQLDVSFTARAGETRVLMGPSGSGKSTCLDLVAGLLAPDNGRIAYSDEVWCDVGSSIELPPERRRVGIVLQDYGLFPHLTVSENIRYGPRARGCRRGAADLSSRHWIDRLGLKGLEDRRVTQLSGGQRQRVALARAIASEPQVLLLDEPFGALDAPTRGDVRIELRALLGEWGLPAVLVTHDAIDAMVFGDQITILENGRVAQAGSREEIVAEPRSSFVANLAGLNVYRVDLANGAGLKLARAAGIVFHVLADDVVGPAYAAFAPSEVTLLARREPGSAQNVFEGRVIEMQPLPDRVRVVLDVGARLAADVTREAAQTLGLGEGRPIWAAVKATAIRVYR